MYDIRRTPLITAPSHIQMGCGQSRLHSPGPKSVLPEVMSTNVTKMFARTLAKTSNMKVPWAASSDWDLPLFHRTVRHLISRYA